MRRNVIHSAAASVRFPLLLSYLSLFYFGPAASAVPPKPSPSPAIILRDADLDGGDAALARALGESLRRAGYGPVTASVDSLLKPGALSPSRCSLLVLPRSGALPAVLITPIQAYLRAGGHLIALGTPAWRTPLIRDENGRWISAERLARSRALGTPPHALFNFDAENSLAAWRRNSNNMGARTRTEIVPASVGARSASALHVRIDSLIGWDTFVSPSISSPFPAGNTFTVLSARGGPRTRALSIEWDERDGSRWIATIPLSTEWRWYALPPSAFHRWESPQPRSHPGFYPPDADHVSVGLAFTHTGWSDGRHEYWVGQLGTSPAPPFSTDVEVPALDSLCPDYKVFDVRGPARVSVSSVQAIARATALVQPTDSIRSSQPRPGGGGFDKRRAWRWIPLLTATDTRSGGWRGSPGTLLVHAPGSDYGGGAWAAFTSQDAAFYRAPAMRGLLEQTARRMREGLFLLDGGAEFYTLFRGESVRLGARMVALPRAGRSVMAAVVRLRVTAPGGRVAWQRAWPLGLRAGETAKRESRWTPPRRWPELGYIVTAELVEQGHVVDRVQHELHVWTPPAHPHFIKIGSDGHFTLNGRLWRALGVNYMPTSGIGSEDSESFEYWLDPQAYDPEIVERDLAHIQNIGLNSVSVFIYVRDIHAQNLLDLLRRCELHHLHVNLALRPGLPSTFVWRDIRSILDYYRLAANDTVFAYDLAWEPGFGNSQERRAMDPAWRTWVDQRYGGLAAAEQAWRQPAPRDEAGALTGPTDAQITAANTSFAGLAGDYRKFLDGWLRETYGTVTKLLHGVDPNHAVSFRMSEAGDPTNSGIGGLPYRFEGLVGAVDFLSPEGYGRIGDWQRVRPGWFEVAFGRAVAPHMPILWAEVGTSAVSGAATAAGAEGLREEGDFYREFLRMAHLSGADGVIFWWYPGGYRTNERSDFGLISPDGTDRPATRAIRQAERSFLDSPVAPKPDVWLDFHSDWRPNSVYNAYQQLGEEFWREVSRGQHPGLRVAPPQD